MEGILEKDIASVCPTSAKEELDMIKPTSTKHCCHWRVSQSSFPQSQAVSLIIYPGIVLEIHFSSHIQQHCSVLYILVSWTSNCLFGLSLHWTLKSLEPKTEEFQVEMNSCKMFKCIQWIKNWEIRFCN